MRGRGRARENQIREWIREGFSEIKMKSRRAKIGRLRAKEEQSNRPRGWSNKGFVLSIGRSEQGRMTREKN